MSAIIRPFVLGKFNLSRDREESGDVLSGQLAEPRARRSNPPGCRSPGNRRLPDPASTKTRPRADEPIRSADALHADR